MFPSSKNLLKLVPCPSLKSSKSCDLHNCLFDHDLDHISTRKRTRSNRTQQEVVKKRVSVSKDQLKPESQSKSELKSEVQSPQDKKGPIASPRSSNNARPIPESKDSTKNKTNSDVPKLVPRQVLPFSPAVLPQRLKMLQVVYDALVKSNIKTQTPVKDAIDMEYDVATKSSNVTYPVNLRRLVAEIRSGKYADRDKLAAEEAEKKTAEQNKRLEKLVISKDHLMKRQYILDENITAKSLEPDFKTKCARCHVEYFVSSKDSTTCQFHLLRREYDHVKKKRSDIFPCCSTPLGESNGCEIRSFHVFKLTDPEYLAGVMPFVRTPEQSGKDTLFAAGLDCEMGYTSLGMELIRVTIVDWTTRITVLDQQVYPLGQILDLNTRFSGVHSLEKPLVLSDGTESHTVSFDEARNLIFKYISASTIMIGHGLENDLIAMRLVHDKVVDTAILYPSLREARTYSLKQLTFKYLGRTIQVGEHDSSEDAVSAMDIVKQHLK